jgi:flagellin
MLYVHMSRKEERSAYAAEMTTFTKNQILLQAGTAMLAQANMAPQQVLALFG